ncbi:MAG: phospho-N-acetylmuramoyl-pentapeptide-transferase [Clostridia bacterium]|nr:phospho-N-acetylmuramoyl-pentapeptide-transferase [Clostridia bacterium]
MESKSLIWAFLISYLTASTLAPVIIPFLQRLKVGQSIREEGPKSHHKKKGTPTMGGVIFIIGTLVAVLIQRNFDPAVGFIMLAFIGFSLIGFADDYIKVVLKRNLGLSAKQKIAGQVMVSAVLSYYAKVLFGTTLFVPFYNQYVDLGMFYIPFVLFVFVAVTNSVNLTDGLDGLSTLVTIAVMTFFCMAAVKLELLGVTKVIFALLGSLVGFFGVNRNPAKVFMGDLGSLALGGAVTAVALATKMVFMIPIVGFIYFAEALSVIIQVAVFKKTGKRVFKMSPLHHHFELSGWDERTVVARFSVVTLVLAFVGYLIINSVL